MTFDVMKWLEAIRTVEGANPPTYYAGQVRCANGLVFVVRAPRPLPPAGLIEATVGQKKQKLWPDGAAKYLHRDGVGVKVYRMPVLALNEIVAGAGGNHLWEAASLGIRAARDAGASWSAIGRKFKLRPTDIARALDPFRFMAQNKAVRDRRHAQLAKAGKPLPPTPCAIEARDDAIARVYRGGASGYAIADKFGLSKARVYQILKKIGVPARGLGGVNAHKPERNAKIIEMWERGGTEREIAAVFGISASRVGQIAQRGY